MVSLPIAFLLALLPYQVSVSDSTAAETPADTLQNAVVTASRVVRGADRTTYVILEADRLKSYDIYSLLDQIANVS